MAQQQGKAFSLTPFARDVATLASNGITVGLWGIDNPGQQGADAMRARVYLDDLIAGQQVRCLTMAGDPASGQVRARCLNAGEKDIGLALISAGLAVVDRKDVSTSELAQTYMGAEHLAQARKLGIWGDNTAPLPSRADAASTAGTSSGAAADILAAIPGWLLLSVLLGVPLLGFFMVAMILHVNFKQLIKLQKYQIAGTQKREKQLKEREKYVIAAALEQEVHSNRAKLDAFLVIYEELLKSLRDPGRTPKYQRAGDIIHEKPALTRTVYDAHVDKLDLLGPQLASDLASLYAMVTPNPDYKTLEPELPIEKAREQVDRIIRGAERLIEPMDKTSGALSVIVRDKRGGLPVSD